MKKIYFLLIFLLPTIVHSANSKLDQLIAKTYIKLKPLILMDLTRRTILAQTRIPENSFYHQKRLFNHKTKQAIKDPNPDFLNTMAWINLNNGPITITGSYFSNKNSFFLLPVYDMNSNIIGIIRPSTNKADKIFKIKITNNITDSKGTNTFYSPTKKAFILLRIATGDDDNFKDIYRFQNELTVRQEVLNKRQEKNQEFPLASFSPKTPPSIVLNKLSPKEFFSYGLYLINTLYINPKVNTALLKDLNNLIKMVQSPSYLIMNHHLFQTAIKNTEKTIRNFANKNKITANNWNSLPIFTASTKDRDILKATVATFGFMGLPQTQLLYYNSQQDPTGGAYEGNLKYRLTFSKNNLPPHGNIWSLTAYDQNHFLMPIANQKYSIGSKDQLHYNKDGSLTVYIQAQKPIFAKKKNWLPIASSAKEINFTLRVYNTNYGAKSKNWLPPAIIKK